MIHAKLTKESLTLNLTLTEESIAEFKYLIDRALNCAAPSKYPDWVALSDKLATLDLPKLPK